MTMRLFLLSGSLRHTSSNTTALIRAATVARDLFDATLYDEIPSLPAFNPDVEELGEASPDFPAAARRLREQIEEADALLVSTPEYAHGMPGALKNTLDWLVGGSGFPELPVGLLNLAAHSSYAAPQLLEVMRTMSGTIVPDACITLDKQATPLGASHDAMHPGAATILRSALEALHAAARRAARHER